MSDSHAPDNGASVPVVDPRTEPIRFANWAQVQLHGPVALLTLGALTADDTHHNDDGADATLEIVGRYAVPPARLAELAEVMAAMAATLASTDPGNPQATAADPS